MRVLVPSLFALALACSGPQKTRDGLVIVVWSDGLLGTDFDSVRVAVNGVDVDTSKLTELPTSVAVTATAGSDITVEARAIKNGLLRIATAKKTTIPHEDDDTARARVDPRHRARPRLLRSMRSNSCERNHRGCLRSRRCRGCSRVQRYAHRSHRIASASRSRTRSARHLSEKTTRMHCKIILRHRHLLVRERHRRRRRWDDGLRRIVSCGP
jgi:hypothetical protein